MTVEYWMSEEQENLTQNIRIVSKDTMAEIMRVFGGHYLNAAASALEKGQSFQKAHVVGLESTEKHDREFAAEHPAFAGKKCQTGNYETCLETFTGVYVGQEGISYKGGRYIFARDAQNFVVAWPEDSAIAEQIMEKV